MEFMSDFPYFEVQFTKKGEVHQPAEVNALLSFLAQNSISDLIVISHGWNNDMADARALYTRLFAAVRAEINANNPPGIAGRTYAILGIMWPSKKFADDELIPSGAASFAAADEQAELQIQLESLKGVFDHPEADQKLEAAIALLPHLETDPNAGAQLIELLRALPSQEEKNEEDASTDFFAMPASELVDLLSRPDLPLPAEEEIGGAASFDTSSGTGGAAGGAAGFDLFGGIKSAVRKALNYTTYYQMKARAGLVGRTGAFDVLRQVRAQAPALKIHLIGHSFGGRLVTALAQGQAGFPNLSIASMTLLQAAFSHNGFAENFDGNRDGFFRSVVTDQRVRGPIIITHSDKDRAVGIAYPLASVIARDDAAAFGDKDNRFGGIGRNGAQFTPEAVNTFPLGANTASYSFEGGKLYNLNADQVITGHSDITRSEVAHALLSAVSVT